MIKMWRGLIEPIFRAIDARRVVEIGAEAGKSTQTLLKYVTKHDGHLDSIDPVPDFDSEALLQRYPNALTFHRDLSLNVLPSLPRFDAVLVDGDHNWYTVYNELIEIERLHEGDPAKFPVILLHDTGWPYGRRDLYYDPDTIPAEFRQPYAQRGISPNKSELATDGGFNMNLCNADHEGGPRNGVCTGVDDYLAQTGLEFQRLDIPLYFGLTVLVTKQRLAANAALQALIDGFTVPDSIRTLMELNEHIRCIDGLYLQAFTRKLAAAEAQIEALGGPKASAQTGGGTS